MSADTNLFPGDDLEDLLVLARVLYPHDGLADAPYARTRDAIIGRASVQPPLYRTLRDGLEELRRALRTQRLAERSTDELEAALRDRQRTAFFTALRPLVAWYLYDDHEVWAFVGYPGAAYELGGYLHRGFDDLDWLPEPRIEEPDEALLEIGPGQRMEVAK